jgi:hypothetical protein
LLSNHRKEKAAGELLVLRWHNTTYIFGEKGKKKFEKRNTPRGLIEEKRTYVKE